MAISEIQERPRLSRPAEQALGGLRRAIRRYVWLEGLAAAAAWLGIAFWTSLAVDWFFEPPRAVRAVLLAVAAAGLVFVILRLIVSRAMVPLADSSMAMLLERRFPQLEDSLLTSVLLLPRRPEVAGYNPDMLARTCREADRRLAGLRAAEVFDPMPLLRKATVAGCLAAIIVLLGVLAPEALGVWLQRSVLLSDRLWPRKIRLEPVGFTDGVAKVASGADFDLLVRAFHGDTLVAITPKQVEIRYRIEGGPRKRQFMNDLGNPANPLDGPAGTVLREYGYTFRAVLAPMRLDIVGGDCSLPPLKIVVVPNPTLESIELEYHYPEYMDRPPETKAVKGTMAVPLGTRPVVHARANKPLQSVRVDDPSEKSPRPRRLEVEALGADARQVDLPLAPLERDTTLLFTLYDADGIKSREAIPLVLAAVPDEPPQLAVRLTGIGPAVTPQARLPLAGQITDDYGIDRVWWECGVDQQKPVEVLLAALAKHPIKYPAGDAPLDAALEARDLNVSRGQKLALAVKASDRCTLGKGPNVGTSETWVLDVVSPDELRAMLEARELVLRQRFEGIVQEVTETRDLLLRMDFAPPGGAKDAAPKAAPKKSAGAEPGDETPRPANLSPAALAERRTERVLQALQACRKNAQETLDLAEAFDDIRQQLTNNRIDTEELKERLGRGIAEPLHRIVGEMFSELERRLETLQAAVADLKTGPARRDAARQQADDILLAMRKVLARMVELEDFNEVVERLRTIIQKHEEIIKRTKERQKQGIRNLSEE
ncbi:MAG: hypothetical protein ABR915_02470 [Thermoguttaceae bacterium]|jgi:hypothetical protein